MLYLFLHEVNVARTLSKPFSLPGRYYILAGYLPRIFIKNTGGMCEENRLVGKLPFYALDGLTCLVGKYHIIVQ